jgi:hypothetical protein
MKLIRLIVLLTLVVLFQLVSSIKHKKKSKKILRSHYHTKNHEVSVFRSNYYGMCVLHDDCSKSGSSCHKNCDNLRIARDYKYNCSENNLKEHQKTNHLPRNEKISETNDLPLDLKKRIMVNSKCAETYFPFIEKFYHKKITSPNKMRIRVVNGFIREENTKKNFYDLGEDVIQHAPIGKNLDFPFVVEQLNLSQELMWNSIRSGFPNPKPMQTNAVIDDLIDGDLKIEKTNLYIVEMNVPLMSDVYHQIFYVCAKGKNSAYHFTFDRAARDPSHEKLSTKKFFIRIFGELFTKMWRTLVRVVYYAKTDTCDDQHVPSRLFYSPKVNVIPQGEKNTLKDYSEWYKNPDHRFVANGSLMKDVESEKSSFKKLFIGVQRYAQRYKKYIPWSENCQHFASGFYNYLTNQQLPYVNEQKMSHMPKESFSHLFSDESDDEFLEKVKEVRGKAKAGKHNK